jgi:FkbM family methyltransferase
MNPLGNPSVPIAEKGKWVWEQIIARYPEVRRENFVELAADPYMLYDHFVNDACRYTPKPGAFVMDIGANAGIFSTFCALNGANVVAYEPNPATAHSFRNTIDRNHLQSKVDFRSEAVWLRTGQEEFSIWIDRPIIGTLSKGRRAYAASKGDPGDRILVRTVSFEDALLAREEWDCVKMDIEGGEFELLPATPLSALRRIKYLTLEVHNDAASKKEYDAMVARLVPTFALTGIPDGSPEYGPEERWVSLFATRRDWWT